MLRDEVGPWLRDRGFRKKRNRFTRSGDAGWQVVDFQASQFGSRTETSFTINLWVGAPELTRGELGGDEQIFERIGHLTDSGEDLWWKVKERTDTGKLAEELNQLLGERGLPWLEERDRLDKLLSVARSRPADFPSHLLERFSMLLAEAGFDDWAEEIADLAAAYD
jgi:hypothetical protein